MSGFQKGAIYQEIKGYVKEKTGLLISSLYISQIKRKYVLVERGMMFFLSRFLCIDYTEFSAFYWNSSRLYSTITLYY